MDLLNVQKEVVIPLFAVRIICSIALYPYASIFEPLIQIIRGIMIFTTGIVNVGTKMEWLITKEAASLWCVSTWQVQILCDHGRYAAKLSNVWVIIRRVEARTAHNT